MLAANSRESKKQKSAPVKFRSVKNGKFLAIESNKGGGWIKAMIGLDAEDVRKQFAKLKREGAVIL